MSVVPAAWRICPAVSVDVPFTVVLPIFQTAPTPFHDTVVATVIVGVVQVRTAEAPLNVAEVAQAIVPVPVIVPFWNVAVPATFMPKVDMAIDPPLILKVEDNVTRPPILT